MTDLTIPYFNDLELEVLEEETLQDTGAQAALAVFLGLTPQDRLRDSRHVYAYYRDFHAAVGGEDWLDAEMGIPDTPQDIWAHVDPKFITVQKDPHADTGWHVVVEANCDWEVEHGLMLVWRGGAQLTKAGPYDGHLTNVNAYANERLADVVYAATDKMYETRLAE